ncbi:LuxR C-terminal-related transcriptional regulator [Pseudomonas sp. LS44]|uniref:LuxR C-terminal-related transcriptional regulator n=1 Tax=Pseudomonas sp. LS44 TaxID=1357074 RepID=UPI0028110D78|nr:LuxR C-terminal-related transcriptional regulator [Pseudomonas sp. LS44]
MHLSRQRLLDPLIEGKQRLRLLCAPAGFGKSVLLSECLNHLPSSSRVVWFDFAGQPLALAQLIAGVVAELGLDHQRIADGPALLGFFERCTEPVWLILDDYPAEASAELNLWLDQLLALSASPVQMLVSCRQRPNWNLPRLFLKGQLLELDAEQLTFSRPEFEALVDLLAKQTSLQGREELWQTTVGWCAGIRLLLCGQANKGKTDAGGLAWLRAYLEHELLERLDDEERSILLGLAHLPKISAELCDQLWEEQSGGLVFKRLLQCQAFFLPLDPQGIWYRMLPAVAFALQNRLGAAELSRLRLRSCQALNAAGHVNEAIEQALRADQPEVAASYMQHLELDWLYTDRHLRNLLAWREQLPGPLLESTPRLICLCTRALLFSWRLDEAAVCVERLGHFLPQPDPQRNRRLLANWQALHGAIQGLSGNAEAAALHCRAALNDLCEQDWRTALLCCSTLARIAMATGNAEQCQQMLLEAVELARRQGGIIGEVLINTDRIRLMILRGELDLAEALLQETFRLVEADHRWHSLLLGPLLFLQGELQLLRGNLDASTEAALSGLQHAQECGDPLILHGLAVLSEVAACRGEFNQALLYLHDAERRMHCGRVLSRCYKHVIDLQVMRVLGRQGRWEQVLPIARATAECLQNPTTRVPPLHTPSLPQRNELLMALAEYEVGLVEQATRRLTDLLEQCEHLQFGGLASEARLALARIGQADGRIRERLVGQPAAHIGFNSLLRDWQADAANEAPTLPLEVSGDARIELTGRELAVLKLLAEGLSNQEIGSALFISLNTVKTHTKKINTKLDVKRRTQAINRAKALGILS